MIGFLLCYILNIHHSPARITFDSASMDRRRYMAKFADDYTPNRLYG